MKRPAGVILALAVTWPFGASACVVAENPTRQHVRKAFARAKLVVTVEVQTETYAPETENGIQRGLATGRILKVEKGWARRGETIAYRVRTGDLPEIHCPVNGETSPGRRYRLFFNSTPTDRPWEFSAKVVLRNATPPE